MFACRYYGCILPPFFMGKNYCYLLWWCLTALFAKLLDIFFILKCQFFFLGKYPVEYWCTFKAFCIGIFGKFSTILLLCNSFVYVISVVTSRSQGYALLPQVPTLTHHEQDSDSPVETSTSSQAQQHQSPLPNGYPNFMFPQVPNGTFIPFQVPNFNLIHREIGCWSKCNRFSVGGSRKISPASDWGKGLAHFANPIVFLLCLYMVKRAIFPYGHPDPSVKTGWRISSTPKF